MLRLAIRYVPFSRGISMSMNSLRKIDVVLITSLSFLAVGSLSLRFHCDFLAGFGISAGVAMIAISAWKKQRPGVS